ncbi:hemerythrin domain-containing protein [Marinospirillum insulare]|uniref:Hemerythrin-like domain-containing protein n=1 Tax=Marinospirillum insulare TaxID=217169 RepID=A0ABQ5ZZ14_9GAMM|nr:hemerythrin domain-containing protein [Marinospirillum insulare]GLR65194.1 hypothetical protein GCM10007878_26330 [Marinospirillum insulare]
MQKLNTQDWKQNTSNQLIDHLLSNFHERHRSHLPRIIELARKIEAVHADHTDCPIGLTQLLQTMQQELESHMMKEEQVLFPMLRQLRFNQASMPIKVMMMEHEEHQQALEQLNLLTSNLVLPKDACGTWQKLYLELALFIGELNQHIEIENTVLFAGKTVDANIGQIR